jgi:3-oxoacyl-[acyl-carrier-protein] synthase II
MQEGNMSTSIARRVVITGMGAITPLGLTVKDFWQGCIEGRSGVVPITKFDHSRYPVHINAEVQGFDPANYIDYKESRRMARFTQFAIAAAREAISTDDLDLATRPDCAGVLPATAMAAFPTPRIAHARRPRRMRIDPFTS